MLAKELQAVAKFQEIHCHIDAKKVVCKREIKINRVHIRKKDNV